MIYPRCLSVDTGNNAKCTIVPFDISVTSQSIGMRLLFSRLFFCVFMDPFVDKHVCARERMDLPAVTDFTLVPKPNEFYKIPWCNCQHFMQGDCLFEEGCRFAHGESGTSEKVKDRESLDCIFPTVLPAPHLITFSVVDPLRTSHISKIKSPRTRRWSRNVRHIFSNQDTQTIDFAFKEALVKEESLYPLWNQNRQTFSFYLFAHKRISLFPYIKLNGMCNANMPNQSWWLIKTERNILCSSLQSAIRDTYHDFYSRIPRRLTGKENSPDVFEFRLGVEWDRTTEFPITIAPDLLLPTA